MSLVFIFIMCFTNFYLFLSFLIYSQEKVDKKSQHKVIQCLKAFMNNKVMP